MVDVQKPDHGANAPSWKVLTPIKKKTFRDTTPEQIIENYEERPAPKQKNNFNRAIGWKLIPIFLLLSAVTIGLFLYYRPQSSLTETSSSIIARASLGIEQGIESLRSLNFMEAQSRFQSLSLEISSSSQGGVFGSLSPATRGWSAISGIGNLLGGYAEFAGVLAELNNQWPDFFNASSTVAPLPLLEKAIGVLNKLEDSHRSLLSSLDSDSTLAAGGSLFGSGYDLTRIRQFLESLTTWLQGGERNMIVLFMNTSELRPGGGFVGSYAHLRVVDGKVQSMTIHDINEPDRLLEESVIPPLEVRTISRNWRAADANWWFDYTLSAEKILQFLEMSEFYQGSTTVRFDGAIGVTPEILKDILAVTGPIELKERGVTMTSDNVVYEIQRDIQEERAEGERLPKGVLSDLYDAVGEQWKVLGADEKAILAQEFFSWIEKKDVVVYARDASLAGFLDSVQASGKIATLQDQQPHDYLAIVNANLGGEKTDLVMKQKVALQSQLDTDGSVRNHLVIERIHEGKEGNDPWHRATNLSRLRVLTPKSAVLELAEGMDRPRISSKTYNSTYKTDFDLEILERTYKASEVSSSVTELEESGKRGFAFWLSTPPQASKKVILDYVHKLPTEVHEGMTYEFAFEKQSGARGDYSFEIVAPVGYRWRENKLAVFNYQSDDPPGRVTFALTLETDR
ncbi:MAG: DUF4012 domain-containing protein [Anaplasmataceae bacterium]|nr:DUF4012 domain-containing protein [Anaplasmataceae bacterium]